MMHKKKINPFHFLQECSQKPFSRFFRTSLREKLKDTFWVFFGWVDSDWTIDTVGLSDYLGMGLFLVIHQFFINSYENSNKDFQSFILLIPSALLNCIAWLIKLSVSALLTLIFFPMVFICHTISWLVGGSALYSRVLSLKGVDKSTSQNSPSNIMLSEFLTRHNLSINALTIKVKRLPPKLTDHLMQTTVNVKSGFTSFFFDNNKENSISTEPFSYKIKCTYSKKEEAPWLSNAHFLYLSTLMMSLFPFLAILSVKSITQSASERISKALTAKEIDIFEIEVESFSDPQRDNISALFKLNLSNLVEDIYHSDDSESALIINFVDRCI